MQNLLSLNILKRFKKEFSNELDNFYIVGGAVRNALIGTKIGDIDICSKLSPQENINLCRAKGIPYFETGIEFGTITILLDKEQIEITSLRKDIKTDGRKAVVSFGHSLEEDAARRDFTINALYLDFNGNLHDFFDGKSDLANKVLRFIGNPKQRIKEDYLRILRFYRFAAQLPGFQLDEISKIATKELFSNINNLAKPRVRQEYFKLMNGKNFATILTYLHDNNLLQNLYGFKTKDSVLPKRLEQISFPLAKLLFFVPLEIEQKNFLEVITTNFALTRKEKKLILLIYNESEIIFKPIKQEDLNYLIAFHPLEIALFLLEISYSHNFIAEKEFNFARNYIISTKVPEFPISAKDLFAYKLPQKEFSSILRNAKIIWAKENFSINKDLLLTKICSGK